MQMGFRSRFFWWVLGLAVAAPAVAQAFRSEQVPFRVEVVTQGLDHPWALAFLPDGRFLVVRGDIRTYRIHLGSGNVRMDPNNQYLCIVQGSEQGRGKERILLPFEGDGMLTVILSKAVLLAADTKIKDPTIVSQIRTR